LEDIFLSPWTLLRYIPRNTIAARPAPLATQRPALLGTAAFGRALPVALAAAPAGEGDEDEGRVEVGVTLVLVVLEVVETAATAAVALAARDVLEGDPSGRDPRVPPMPQRFKIAFRPVVVSSRLQDVPKQFPTV